MDEVRYDLERLVTVRTFAEPWAAQLGRARLEAAGIEAVVADEHLSRMITINTVGGARLQVREQDAAAAAEVLAREEPIPELYLVTDDDAAGPRCPGCRSERISFERWSRLGFVTSWIFLGIPVPVPRNRWLCRSCGAAWKEEDLPPRRPLQADAPEPPETVDAFAEVARRGPRSDLAGGMQSEPNEPDMGSELRWPSASPRLALAVDDSALVAVGRFAAPWEAHLARTRLETEGIAACVLEERLPVVSLISGQLTALSRVAVHADDARRAREILATEPDAARGDDLEE